MLAIDPGTSIVNTGISTLLKVGNLTRAPTHFLVNTSFSISLYKTKAFDYLIKMLIPTSGCLLQSIYGPLKFAYLVSIFRIHKTFGLHHIQLFINVSIEERRFDIHLPYLIIIICSNC